MAHVALAWINKRISSPIIGFSSAKRMDEAIEANGKELSDEEERYLEEPYQAKKVAGFDTSLIIVSRERFKAARANMHDSRNPRNC